MIKKGITINDLIIKIAAAYEQIFNNNDYFIDSIEHVNSLLLSDAKYNNYNWFTEITPLWTFVRILHWSTKKFRKFISEEYGILIKDYQFTSLKTFKDLEILINNQIKDKECEDKQIAFRTPDSPSTKSSLIKEDSSKKRVQPKESETIEDFDFENIVFSEE